MEAENIFKLKSIEPYRYLFPKPTGVDHTVKKRASVSDTVYFIPEVVEKCRWMVKNYVRKELKGLPLHAACRKLWYFVKEHIAYEKDDPNYQKEKDIRDNLEQVRSPRRLIAEGKGDCDCMTTFVDTCMTEYGVKGIINRITEYDHKGYFQHIYSLIPDGKGKYIIMDCVWNAFNEEKPYTKKEDHIMELQFLDGIGNVGGLESTERKYTNIDAQDLFGNEDEFGELGKLFRKKNPEQKQAAKEKRKAILKKGRKIFNVVNKVNPATALLRAGILLSMKLNIMKVPETLKWGYATREQAQARGMDMRKYDKLQKVREKIENIFYAAGGKPENLRKAILTGRGNRNKEVSGFDGLSESMSVQELLGDIYTDEFVNGMEGFEGFGDLTGGEGLGIATEAAVASATTVMGTIAALLKSIGSLFPKGKKGSSQNAEEGGSESSASSDEGGGEQSEEESGSQSSEPSEEQTSTTDALPAPINENTDLAPIEDPSGEESKEEESTDGILSGIGTGIKTFYQAHKKWIVPVAGVAAVGTVIYLISRSNTSKEEELHPQIDGVKAGNKKKKKNKAKKIDKNSVIELM